MNMHEYFGRNRINANMNFVEMYSRNDTSYVRCFEGAKGTVCKHLFLDERIPLHVFFIRNWFIRN